MSQDDVPFPINHIGVMSQHVSANPKCEGCIHYDHNRGTSGVCTIGLQPFTCGDGSTPTIGYGPVARLSPTFQPPAPRGAYANDSGKDNVAIAMRLVVLGEEHAEMVKSIQASVLEMPGMQDHAYNMQTQRAAAAHTADRFCKSLTNKERFVLGAHSQELAELFADAVVSGLDGTAVKKSMAAYALEKGFYGHEWLAQFKGTDLFDEAVKICEEEIAREEASVAKRVADAKRRKELEAKMRATDDPWEVTQAADSELRLRKDKLQIRLAKQQQKTLTK